MSLACRLAYAECRSIRREFSDVGSDIETHHVICHVTLANKSFIVQQSMALQTLYERSIKRTPSGTCINIHYNTILDLEILASIM